MIGVSARGRRSVVVEPPLVGARRAAKRTPHATSRPGEAFAADPCIAGDDDRFTERGELDAGLCPVDQHRLAKIHQRVGVQRMVVWDDDDRVGQRRVTPFDFWATGWRLPCFTSCGWIRTINCRSGVQAKSIVDHSQSSMSVEGVAVVVELRVPEDVGQQPRRRQGGVELEVFDDRSRSCSSGRSAASGVIQVQSPRAAPTVDEDTRAVRSPGCRREHGSSDRPVR